MHGHGQRGTTEEWKGQRFTCGHRSGTTVLPRRVAHGDARRRLGITEFDRLDDVLEHLQPFGLRFRRSGALDAVLADIQQLESSLHASPLLATVPQLRRVALEIAQLALAPIRHLLR